MPQDATSAATQDILVSTSTGTIAIILYADSTPPALSGPCYSPPATLITDVSGGDEDPTKGLQEQVSQLIPDLHQPFLRENTEGDRLLFHGCPLPDSEKAAEECIRSFKTYGPILEGVSYKGYLYRGQAIYFSNSIC